MRRCRGRLPLLLLVRESAVVGDIGRLGLVLDRLLDRMRHSHHLDDLTVLGVVGVGHHQLDDCIGGFLLDLDIRVQSTDVVAQDDLFQCSCLNVSDLNQPGLERNNVWRCQCERLGAAFPLDQLLLGQLALLCHGEREIYAEKL